MSQSFWRTSQPSTTARARAMPNGGGTFGARSQSFRRTSRPSTVFGSFAAPCRWSQSFRRTSRPSTLDFSFGVACHAASSQSFRRTSRPSTMDAGPAFSGLTVPRRNRSGGPRGPPLVGRVLYGHLTLDVAIVPEDLAALHHGRGTSFLRADGSASQSFRRTSRPSTWSARIAGRRSDCESQSFRRTSRPSTMLAKDCSLDAADESQSFRRTSRPSTSAPGGTGGSMAPPSQSFRRTSRPSTASLFHTSFQALASRFASTSSARGKRRGEESAEQALFPSPNLFFQRAKCRLRARAALESQLQRSSKRTSLRFFWKVARTVIILTRRFSLR